MTAYSGVLKIVRFNWPWYAGAVAATAAAILLLRSGVLPGLLASVVLAALIGANVWVLLSLAVSHYVYDRSRLRQGAWLDGVDATRLRCVVVLHAGQDEASDTAARLLPSAEIKTFDFYGACNGTPSLKRARALAPKRDLVINSNNVPLKNETLELGLVVFAAHEIRDDVERAGLFRELRRVLAPTGRVIVVEHLRDGWNFLAYGPGAFHFFSEQKWRRSFANGGLKLMRETSCTRFVRIFELAKAS